MPASSWSTGQTERSPARRKFDDCIQSLAGTEFDALSEEVRAARARLDEPMRVAVAGQVSRGKSTLINAIIGEDMLAVGRAETTFNVSELHYSDTPSLLVHYKDGRPARSQTPGDLHRLTVHSPMGRQSPGGIRKIEFGLPIDFLKSFRLIDTPGLRSVYTDDSLNAEAALGIDSDHAHRDSVYELEQADAVLFLFSRGVHEQDLALVADFADASPGAVTPVQSIGVLAKSDESWPPADADAVTFDPIAQARRTVSRYLRRPDVSRLFYTVVPIAGLVAHGARTLTGATVASLSELSRLDPSALVDQLGSAGRFVAAGDRGEPDETARLELLDRFGPWGIFRAARYLASAPDAELHQVRDHLWDASGVKHLHRLMSSHFGNRAGLIKLHRAVRQVQGRLTGARDGAAPGRSVVLDEALGHIEDIERSAHSFEEMRALSTHYSHQLDFDVSEIQELLRVTGESGTDCFARLGMKPDEPLAELSRRAKERGRYWQRRLNASMLGPAEHRVARTLLRSYDRISQCVWEAQRLLDLKE